MAIVIEQIVTGDTTSSATSITLPSWTPLSNELVLVWIDLRNEAINPS
jgi:hypothetical protein